MKTCIETTSTTTHLQRQFLLPMGYYLRSENLNPLIVFAMVGPVQDNAQTIFPPCPAILPNLFDSHFWIPLLNTNDPPEKHHLLIFSTNLMAKF